MWEDPVVKEVRRARDAHAAKFGYDIDKIFDDILRQQKASGLKFVTLKSKQKLRRSNKRPSVQAHRPSKTA
jgi:hypothetical protein